MQATLAGRVDKFPVRRALLAHARRSSTRQSSWCSCAARFETGFRAPNLTESATSSSPLSSRVIDPKRCDAGRRTRMRRRPARRARPTSDPQHAASWWPRPADLRQRVLARSPTHRGQQPGAQAGDVQVVHHRHGAADDDTLEHVHRLLVDPPPERDQHPIGARCAGQLGTRPSRAWSQCDPAANDPTLPAQRCSQLRHHPAHGRCDPASGAAVRQPVPDEDFGCRHGVNGTEPCRSASSGCTSTPPSRSTTGRTARPTTAAATTWPAAGAIRSGWSTSPSRHQVGPTSQSLRWTLQSGTSLQGDFNDPSYTQDDCPGEGLTADQCRLPRPSTASTTRWSTPA